VEGLSQQFEKWGPNARICLESAEDPSKVAMFETIAQDVARVYARDPERYSYNQAIVSLCASHSLFTVMPSTESRITSYVTIKTNYLRNLVAIAVAELNAAAQVNFYTQMSKHPWFKSSSGYIFEKFVFTWLFSNPTSEGLLCTPADTADTTDTAAPEPFTLYPVGSESVFVFEGCKALTRAQDHTTSGWLPAALNFPSIDAIIFTDGLIVTIQSTISSTHDAKDIGFKQIAQGFKKALRYFRSLQWRHIFVTHSDENAQQLRSQSLPGLESKRIWVYSAVLNPANLRLTPQKLHDAQRIRVRGFKSYPRLPSLKEIIRTVLSR
jgi:hypothetical protein